MTILHEHTMLLKISFSYDGCSFLYTYKLWLWTNTILTTIYYMFVHVGVSLFYSYFSNNSTTLSIIFQNLKFRNTLLWHYLFTIYPQNSCKFKLSTHPNRVFFLNVLDLANKTIFLSVVQNIYNIHHKRVDSNFESIIRFRHKNASKRKIDQSVYQMQFYDNTI